MTKNRTLKLSQIVLSVGCALTCMQAGAAGKTYTLDADFDLGTAVNVNHNAPNSNQLQLNTVTSTFPVLWVANAGEDTVSKIDTLNNKEIARYRTWFGPAGQPGYYAHLGAPWTGPAPSRTAVDKDGNAYVLNRHFEGRPAMLMKILTQGGIDRNGNSVIDTSSDTDNNGGIGAGEILPLADSNGNGVLDPAELTDERVAWAVTVGPANGLGRSLCIGTDGHLWVGLYNSQTYYKVSSVNGAILAGPVSTAPTAGQPSAGSWTPYGCLIDANGTLWSASLTGVLGKITNTQSNVGPWTVSSFGSNYQNYGIALGNGMVYLGAIGNPVSYVQFNPATNTFSLPAQGPGYYSTGIGVDGAGDIITGPYGSGGLTKYHANGTIAWTAPTQLASETRGVIPDQDNNLWQVSRTGNRIMKYRGSDGAPLGMVQVGDNPYTYSDASGSTVLGQTTPSGNWAVIYDGGAAGAKWGTVSWHELVPTGGSLTVKVRSADLQANLPLQPWTPVSNNVAFNGTGRFIQVQADLGANAQNQSPVLYDLTIAGISTAVCDVDGDGDIDQNDLALISKGRGQTPTANDPRDANRDGKIDPLDVKVCIPKCTRANCAIQ